MNAMSKLKTGIVAAGVLLALAVGVSYAAIPSANGTISACVKPNGEIQKLVDAEAGETCGGNKHLVSWNEQGPPGLSGYEVVKRSGYDSTTDTQWARAICPTGKVPIGGGGRPDAPVSMNAVITQSIPEPEYNSWRVDAKALNPPGTTSWGVEVYAICATVAA
jgi:hypothetical protein